MHTAVHSATSAADTITDNASVQVVVVIVNEENEDEDDIYDGDWWWSWLDYCR